MQNQIALYLIFAAGIILIIAALIDSDYLLGRKESYKATQGKFKEPLLTRILLRMFRSNVIEDDGSETVFLDRQRRNRRILFIFLGALLIVLGIIALNSGKFS